MTADVIPFAPRTGAQLIEQARQARAVPPQPPRYPRGHLGNMSRSGRVRAVAGVATAMLSEAEQVLDLIAAGRTADGPLTGDDVQQLASFGRSLISSAAITAMIDDLEAIHGR